MEEAEILSLLPLTHGPVSEQPEIIKKLSHLNESIRVGKKQLQVTAWHLHGHHHQLVLSVCLATTWSCSGYVDSTCSHKSCCDSALRTCHLTSAGMLAQDLAVNLRAMEELTPAQALCASRATLLFEGLDDLEHLEGTAHCQVDHVGLLRQSLQLPHELPDGTKRKDHMSDVIDHHTISVLEKAARSDLLKLVLCPNIATGFKGPAHRVCQPVIVSRACLLRRMMHAGAACR